jgi:DNA modification methylase
MDDGFRFRNSDTVDLHVGDCIEIMRQMPAASFHTCVTSPPYYGLRDYSVAGQIGLEETPEAYVTKLVAVFREVHRLLRDDGTLWLNLGDSYARNGGSDQTVSATAKVGSTRNSIEQRGDRTQTVPVGLKSKDLIGIPWSVAFALRADGWWLRSDVIWAKGNPMPESIKDRPTSAHEHVFLLAKAEHYYYNADAVREPTVSDRMRGPALHPDRVSTNGNAGLARRAISDQRNQRNVWTINTRPYTGAHFATMPEDLARPCILASCPEGGSVLDPFGGAGTTGLVAADLDRTATLIELNPDYAAITRRRLQHRVKPNINPSISSTAA